MTNKRLPITDLGGMAPGRTDHTARPGAAPAFRCAAAALLALAAAPVLAHPGAHDPALHGAAQQALGAQLAAGFAHPFTGIDHLLAMLGAGIWSVRQPRGGMLAAVLALAMLGGALGGAVGMAIPGLEHGIAATVALTGVLVALAARLPAPAGMALMALFAVLHGNAHGQELPALASAAGYLAASGVLVAAGRWFGQAAAGAMVRLAGAGVAATGVLLLAA